MVCAHRISRTFLICVILLFSYEVFSQEQDTLPKFQRTFQDTVISKIQISSEPIESDSSQMPMMIQLMNKPAQKLTIEKIATEIPNNDTITQVVSFKVITTEELVAKEQKMAKIESAPVKEKITATDTKKAESFADPEDIAIEGRTYKIQVAALQTESKELLAKIKKQVGTKIPVLIETDNNMKKYMVGSFNTYFEAAQYRDSLVKNGHKGAFVVVYFKNKRVSRYEGGFKKVKTN